MPRECWLGWSKALWKKFGAVALPVVGIPLGLNQLTGLDLTAGFAMMTAVVLLAYTLETQEMRRQMVLQNEIAIQPVVMIAGIELRPVDSGVTHGEAHQIILRNIGKGPALFIQARDIEAWEQGELRYVARFSRVDYIAPGEDAGAEVTLHLIGEAEERRSRIDFLSNLDPRYAVTSYDVAISYENVGGQGHESVVRMGVGGIRLLRQGRVAGTEGSTDALAGRLDRLERWARRLKWASIAILIGLVLSFLGARGTQMWLRSLRGDAEEETSGLSESLGTTVTRGTESRQFLIFVFGALVTFSWGLIGEIPDQSPLRNLPGCLGVWGARWSGRSLRITLRLAIFSLLVYGTLIWPTGRNWLVDILNVWKLERHF